MMVNSLPSKYSTCLIILTYLFIGFCIYLNSFDVPFYFDDTSNVQHPSLQIDEISKQSLSEAVFEGQLKSRPISNLSFALNYYFSGDRVQSYHLVNILVHCLNAVFLFLLIEKTLRIQGYTEKIRMLAFFAALLWLVHPVNTQSVTYIVQRMNSLAALFYIISLLAFCSARVHHIRRDHKTPKPDVYILYGISSLSALLAFGAKENVVTLLPVIFLYEWFFFRNLSLRWLKRNSLLLIPLCLLIMLLAWHYTHGNILDVIMGGFSSRDFTLSERLLTQARVIVHYLSLLIYPHPDRLVLDYDIILSTSLFKPVSTSLAILFHLALLAFACVSARDYRLFSFCLLWFYINLCVESTIIPLEMVYEHRLYLPSMFLPILLILIPLNFTIPRSYTLPVLLCTSIILSYWTIQRNSVWAQPLTFWQKNIERFPNDLRVHINLGVHYYHSGDLQKAEQQFRYALSQSEKLHTAHYNLAAVHYKNGKFELAEHSLQRAIEIKNDYINARMLLAKINFQQGEFAEAKRQYEYVYKKYPTYSLVNLELGRIYLQENMVEDALFYLKKAEERQAGNPILLSSLAASHNKIGSLEKSASYYNKLLEISPNNLIALYNLAVIYTQTGNYPQALTSYRKAYTIQTQVIPVAYSYGNLLLQLGNYAAAEEAYTKAIDIRPILANSYNNLGLVHINLGNLQKATDNFSMALQIDPAHQLAANNKKLAEELLLQNTVQQ